MYAIRSYYATRGFGNVVNRFGGNGAGKTTTINLFLNFIEPTEGEARVA